MAPLDAEFAAGLEESAQGSPVPKVSEDQLKEMEAAWSKAESEALARSRRGSMSSLASGSQHLDEAFRERTKSSLSRSFNSSSPVCEL